MTPAPEAVPGSGLGPDTEVSWTVALGRAFTNIVAKGSTAATAASDHTVKADIRGLAPATDRTAPGGPRPQPRPVGRHTDDRRELLAHLRDNAIRNTVFHTGDIHMVWANDVPLNAGTYPLSASAATEFVVTSVTSDNIDDLLKVPEGTGTALASPLIHAANRHVHCVDTDRHGYGVLDLTAERAQMDFSVLSDRTEAAATSSWARSYGTRSGTQKVERAYDPV